MRRVTVVVLPATDTQGTRFRATFKGRSMTVARDYALSHEDQREQLVREIVKAEDDYDPVVRYLDEGIPGGFRYSVHRPSVSTVETKGEQ